MARRLMLVLCCRGDGLVVVRRRDDLRLIALESRIVTDGTHRRGVEEVEVVVATGVRRGGVGEEGLGGRIRVIRTGLRRGRGASPREVGAGVIGVAA